MEHLAELGLAVRTGFAWPLLIWTFIAALALWADGRWPSRAPLFRHRLLLLLLLSLPASVLLRIGLNLIPPAPQDVAPPLTLLLPEWEFIANAPAPLANDVLWLTIGAFAGGAALASLFAIVRLGMRYVQLHRALEGVLLPLSAEVSPMVEATARTVGIPVPRVVHTPLPLPPFSMGVWRPRIVLPSRALADRARLSLILLHEMAHLRHRDAALDLMARIGHALLVWHPFAGRILSRLELLREQACDAVVLAHCPDSRAAYAHLLVAHAHPISFPVASLAVPTSHLTSRIRMLHLHMQVRPVPTLVLALFFALLVLPLGLHVQAQTTETPPPSQTRSGTQTQPELLPNTETALRALMEQIRYPEQARAEGIEGRVVVRIVIDPSGAVADAILLRGIGGGCDEEALRVSRTLRFSPALDNGNPVASEVVLPIVFRLAEGQPTTPPNPPAPPPPAPQPPAPDGEFRVVERAPQLLPSDREAFIAMQQGMRYPEIARSNGVEGLVVVQFVVDRDGAITQTQIAGTTATVNGEETEPSREAVQALEQEALRVISTLQFAPGTRHGQPHPIEMRLPINFRLSQ